MSTIPLSLSVSMSALHTGFDNSFYQRLWSWVFCPAFIVPLRLSSLFQVLFCLSLVLLRPSDWSHRLYPWVHYNRETWLPHYQEFDCIHWPRTKENRIHCSLASRFGISLVEPNPFWELLKICAQLCKDYVWDQPLKSSPAYCTTCSWLCECIRTKMWWYFQELCTTFSILQVWNSNPNLLTLSCLQTTLT